MAVMFSAYQHAKVKCVSTPACCPASFAPCCRCGCTNMQRRLTADRHTTCMASGSAGKCPSGSQRPASMRQAPFDPSVFHQYLPLPFLSLLLCLKVLISYRHRNFWVKMTVPQARPYCSRTAHVDLMMICLICLSALLCSLSLRMTVALKATS